MTLTTRQRSSIYRKLVPVLGEEDADALMAEFPAAEHDELVTRAHLRAEMAELRGEMVELRSELRGDTAQLRIEMHELRAELQGLVRRTSAASTGVLLAALGLVAALL